MSDFYISEVHQEKVEPEPKFSHIVRLISLWSEMFQS